MDPEIIAVPAPLLMVSAPEAVCILPPNVVIPVLVINKVPVVNVMLPVLKLILFEPLIVELALRVTLLANVADNED